MRRFGRQVGVGLLAGAACVPCAAGGGGGAGSRGGDSGGWRAFRDPTVQDHGLRWSKVGDPGNPNAVIPPTFPGDPPTLVGRANYRYRITTREVNATEWFEFVQAYAPYIDHDAANSSGIVSGGIIQFTGFTNGVPQYRLVEGFENRPVKVAWRYAARFVNWLHNDKADSAEAFETGVYDTSTFGQMEGGGGFTVLTDQVERSEGARFWIPSFDEWTKAAYWDPDRFGEDMGGYWQYPITSDTAPVPGAPDQGGQTNAGQFPPGQPRPLDVGSYPDVTSPWGLLDASGGVAESLEDAHLTPWGPVGRFFAGSAAMSTSNPATIDVLGHFSWSVPISVFGFRVASVIPAPATVGGLALVCCGGLVRRRKPCDIQSLVRRKHSSSA